VSDIPGESTEGASKAPPPDVSVVVVNTNAGEDVVRCVRSVYESVGDVALEVIVVDNRSTDGSVEAVERDFPQARVFRNETNRGFAAAANRGMLATRSEFVFLLNPDAEVRAGTFEGLLKVARDRPRAAAIGVLTLKPDGSVYPSARRQPSTGGGLAHTVLAPFWPQNPWSRQYRMAGWDRRSPRPVDWVSGSSVLLRREALDRVGVFDEGFWLYVEDLDLCTRLRQAGWEVWFSPELEVVHIQGTVTAGKRWATLQHSKSMYRYVVKYRTPGWRATLRPLAWGLLRFRAAVVSWRGHER
jgi:N-acetylglucosaminyl-diphospho-decaprenol L-rhamnosyltransferase